MEGAYVLTLTLLYLVVTVFSFWYLEQFKSDVIRINDVDFFFNAVEFSDSRVLFLGWILFQIFDNIKTASKA